MSNSSASDVFQELRKFLEILKNHLKTIIWTTIVTVVVFAIAIFFVIKPQYQSTTQMIVDQKVSKNIQDTQLQGLQQADVQLVNTYKGIITSPTVSDRVQKKLGNNKLAQKSKVSVNTQPNSQVFDISTKSASPAIAAKVSNETARVFKQRIGQIMRSSSANVIATAKPNPTPVFPKKTLGLLLGIFVGLILGVALALFEEFGAKTVVSMNYITKNLGLTNLGIIDDINLKNIKQSAKERSKHERPTEMKIDGKKANQ